MEEETKRLFDVAFDGVGLLLSIGTIILAYVLYKKGIKEYKENNKTKRAEFLEKLIESFNDQSLKIAKDVIDDFVYPNHAEYKSLDQYYALPCVNLVTTLRNHNDTPDGITDSAELEIRESFSAFLDFLFKLSYYLKNDLITPIELGYFKYYIERINYLNANNSSDDAKRDAFRKEGVRIFIKTYFNADDYERLFRSLQSN